MLLYPILLLATITTPPLPSALLLFLFTPTTKSNKIRKPIYKILGDVIEGYSDFQFLYAYI